MIGLNAQKALEPMLNMRFLGLVIMSIMVILQFYGANAATGYKPSQFQEDKGDFSARPKGGPFQRTGKKISARITGCKKHYVKIRWFILIIITNNTF